VPQPKPIINAGEQIRGDGGGRLRDRHAAPREQHRDECGEREGRHRAEDDDRVEQRERLCVRPEPRHAAARVLLQGDGRDVCQEERDDQQPWQCEWRVTGPAAESGEAGAAHRCCRIRPPRCARSPSGTRWDAGAGTRRERTIRSPVAGFAHDRPKTREVGTWYTRKGPLPFGRGPLEDG
jgi:hypothetical protein